VRDDELIELVVRRLDAEPTLASGDR